MIYVGIDDTDTVDAPGTNQLARALVARVAGGYRPVLIVRHQLLFDPRVPYTSKNGSASIQLEPRGKADLPALIAELRNGMREWFQPASDPGLCVTTQAPAALSDFGRRCQQELVRQREARHLASFHGLHLEGLGGTEDGVIGALAAVGLAATGNDGRVVQIGSWPDDLSGPQPIDKLHQRDVEVRRHDSGEKLDKDVVDVGKHLRPNYRDGRVVLFVEPAAGPGREWQALKLP